ncbi:MAG: nucleoside hydrolase [Acidobacteria bacterium]|nr:nucleoside hydrolase [Acidobacteriota bacterium]
MGNDIDDALALAMIHSLESRGECRLLAVTLTKDHPKAAPFVDAINTFYKRGSVPIGAVRDGKTQEEGKYLGSVADHPDLFPRDLTDGASAPDAVDLLRKTLAAQPDGSVTIVQVGFSTNLARLIASEPDRELVRRKVKLLSLMGGAFPPTLAEYNIKIDLEASRSLFALWPTPIVASGFEIGRALLFPATSIEKDFAYVAHHPVVAGYRAYMKMPYDRPSWDLTSVLYAVRPDRAYFGLSPAGTISIDAQGYSRFTPGKQGAHRYLTMTEEQQATVLATLIALASEPPH